MSDEKSRAIIVAPSSELTVASRLAERTLAVRAARAAIVEGDAAEAPPFRMAPMLDGLDAPWTPPDAATARAAMAAVAHVCQTYCPVVDHCVAERCRLYRLEQEAVRFLREGPEPSRSAAT